MNHFDMAKQIEIAREIRAVYVANLVTSLKRLAKQWCSGALFKQASTTDA